MDKNKITELAEKSYEKGYNEGFYDAAEATKHLLDRAIAVYKEITEGRLKEINKYWEGKTNEKTDEKRTDK